MASKTPTVPSSQSEIATLLLSFIQSYNREEHELYTSSVVNGDKAQFYDRLLAHQEQGQIIEELKSLLSIPSEQQHDSVLSRALPSTAKTHLESLV